jgi:hypothetical protein
MIGRYEAGGAAPDVNLLGRIASYLRMEQFNVNGYQFAVRPQTESPGPDTSEQFRLAFDKEHVYTGATLRITPTRLNLTITAFAAEPQKSQRADNKVQVS